MSRWSKVRHVNVQQAAYRTKLQKDGLAAGARDAPRWLSVILYPTHGIIVNYFSLI